MVVVGCEREKVSFLQKCGPWQVVCTPMDVPIPMHIMSILVSFKRRDSGEEEEGKQEEEGEEEEQGGKGEEVEEEHGGEGGKGGGGKT